MPHQKSSDYKETTVQYYLVEDKTQEEVCKIFKCSRRSLMRWVDKYNKDGEITGYERTPKAYKVHKKLLLYLTKHLCFIQCRDISAPTQHTHNGTIHSNGTICLV